MYGEGKVTEHPEEAARFAAAVRQNVKDWQGRAQAALKVLRDDDRVDPKKLAAIGHCFGGSTALELAYSGADLAAVVTFHAALPVPDEEQAKAIKAQVLINHGAADSFIPEETCQKVRAALEAGKVDYEFIYYGGAVHSFTVAGSEKVGRKGMAYNAAADRRSWLEMLRLFDDVFDGRTREGAAGEEGSTPGPALDWPALPSRPVAGLPGPVGRMLGHPLFLLRARGESLAPGQAVRAGSTRACFPGAATG